MDWRLQAAPLCKLPLLSPFLFPSLSFSTQTLLSLPNPTKTLPFGLVWNAATKLNLKYPFWGEDRGSICGGPNYESEELTCEGQVPKITINFIRYRVLGWENTSQILKVARDDYWDNNTVCVNGDRNITFDNTQFQYDYDGLVNVTLFYDCPASSPTPTNSLLPPSSVFSFSCGGASVVYYTVQPLPSSYEAPCKIDTHTHTQLQ